MHSMRPALYGAFEVEVCIVCGRTTVRRTWGDPVTWDLDPGDPAAHGETGSGARSAHPPAGGPPPPGPGEMFTRERPD